MIMRSRSPRNHWPCEAFRHQTEVNSRSFQIEIFNFVSNKKYKEMVTKLIHIKTDIQKLVYTSSYLYSIGYTYSYKYNFDTFILFKKPLLWAQAKAYLASASKVWIKVGFGDFTWNVSSSSFPRARPAWSRTVAGRSVPYPGPMSDLFGKLLLKTQNSEFKIQNSWHLHNRGRFI